MIKIECMNCGRIYEKLPERCNICGRRIFRTIDQKRFDNH